MENMRSSEIYGGLIAFISGLYSVSLGMNSMNMASMWLMNILGAIVLFHGFALLVDLDLEFMQYSGELMIGYSAVMLLNQAWMYSMGMLDQGMVAIATVMLGNGVIMYRRDSM